MQRLEDGTDDGAISSPIENLCKCCGLMKTVRMYVIQTGDAVFICKDCRNGRTQRD